MKKILCLILALLLGLSCAACGGSGKSDGGPASAAELPKNVQMYAPGTAVTTDFGTVTVLDAAFCTKAQIYYTKSSRSSKVTIDGKTTQTHEETIHPGYISTMDNKLVFALKTLMTNTTDQDLEIHNLQAKAYFVDGSPVYFSKGGNFHISDEAYKILPAGESAEIVMAALVPVEQYLLASECLLEMEGGKLGFGYDSIHVYNALGFQEGDNAPVTIDEVIQAAASTASPAAAPTEAETEPAEPEVEVVTVPGKNTKTGTAAAEGRAIAVENVALGFRDQLPAHVREHFKRKDDVLTLNSSQVYAMVKFTATNLTTDTVDLADLHDDFMVQLNYDNGYLYSTNTDVYSVYESGSSFKMLRSNGSSGNDIAVSPLASADVTVYIPCAKQVAQNADKPLTVSFIAQYSGSESLVFEFPGRSYTPAQTSGEPEDPRSGLDITLYDGTNKKTGEAKAEGRALVIENVAMGFRDQLPEHILEHYDSKVDQLTLNDSQTYAVVVFTVTNLTAETVDLADLHDDFLVQVNYNNGYRYSTDADVYSVYESGANYKMLRKNGSSGNDISVSPLTTAEVTVYIPCAKQVAQDQDKPLTVTFVSRYSGNENYEFKIR